MLIMCERWHLIPSEQLMLKSLSLNKNIVNFHSFVFNQFRFSWFMNTNFKVSEELPRD